MKINGSVKDVFRKGRYHFRTGNFGDVYGVQRDDGVWTTLTNEHFKDIRPRVGSRISLLIEDSNVVSATVTKF